ncbi:MAG: NAD(+) diphosphatase [Pseudomonadota bacterium]
MLDLGLPAPADRTQALHVVFASGKLVMDLRNSDPCFLGSTDIMEEGWSAVSEQFVGHWNGQPCFAIEVSEVGPLDPMRYQMGSLYTLLGRVDDRLFAVVGRAYQLLRWEDDHRFCGRCADPLEKSVMDNSMSCASCDLIVYPRISPCAICLVRRGDQILLARNANFPRPMYSTLAGFVEAGESVEETVRREVEEEVGVIVGHTEYFGSQPWPFPSQLMLGFFADYVEGDIQPDQEEIVDAGWYNVDSLPMVPPTTSIAGQLIQEHCRRVRQR